jgi:hypothetical protein
MKKHLPFGKDWEEDILSLSKEHMFRLFKMACIRLLIAQKELSSTKKELSDQKRKNEISNNI